MNKLQNDIERYLEGNMSPAEMHALEKRALSDPFLADALEGAGLLNADQFKKDLADLERRLEKPDRKVIPIWGLALRIAAGLAFLIVASVVIYNLTSDTNDGKLTENKVESEQIPESSAATDGVKQDSMRVDSSKSEMKAGSSSIESFPNGPIASAAPPSGEDDAEPVARTQDAAVVTPVPEQPEEIAIAEEELLVPEPVGASAKREAMADKKVFRQVVTGTVLDSEDGRGLPGVNVTIKGTNIGTVTDEEGRYQIPMDSLNDGLLFSFIGFESREAVPGSTLNLDVTLSPDVSQLSEVVVVGYSPTKEPEELPVIEMAAPAGGRKAYKQYLEKGLRYPEQALNNKIEGKVTVQFTIETSGKIGEFQVLKGIGYGCDEEVIRLIKEGPAWVPTRRNKEPVKDKVKVRLRFSLPEKKKE